MTIGITANLTDDLLMAMEPVAFARAAGIEPDDWQADVLRSSASRMLLNCSRQSGKSTVTSVLAVHAALYDPGALVLLLSPSLRQSQELFRKCLDTYRAVDRPVPASAESALRLELENGSRIVSLPGTEGAIRGFSAVRLLIVDEAARVETSLYMSVRPMLAVSAGRLIGLSTPFGTRGWWYEAWRGGEPWERYEISAAICPRIPAAFLAEEKRNMGEWWYAQEYECRFMESQTSVFTREEIERAFTEEVETWPM